MLYCYSFVEQDIIIVCVVLIAIIVMLAGALAVAVFFAVKYYKKELDRKNEVSPSNGR